jgi:ribonuclease R
MAHKQEKKIQKKIISFLKTNKNSQPTGEIKKSLGISKKNSKHFENALTYLIQSGRISKDAEGIKMSTGSGSQMVIGELRITRGGFGFVSESNRKIDIFISRDHLNTAFDRDIVEVKLYARHRGKNQEGFVTRIVERKRNQFVGTFHKTKYYGFMVPDDSKVYRDFFIPKENQKNVKDGQKILVSLEKWDTDHLNPEGKILEVIGFPGEPGVDVASVAYSFSLAIKFPEHVETEAQDMIKDLDKSEIKKRLDLRKLEIFTIDPPDAKDFDDAVSLEILKNGNYKLGVHIADVSHYVRKNSILDQEAFNRGTSVYLVDRVIPMLPESISNQLCSLQPEQDKFTYSCIMEVTTGGKVVEYDIQPTLINSKRRFTYEEVQNILDNKKDDPYYSKLKEMMKFSKILTQKRFKEGGIDFETPEVDILLDSKGFPVKIIRKERFDSNRLIEEFMLLANKTVATHIEKQNVREKKLPFIYRIHQKPNEEKMKNFFEFLHAIGVKFQPIKQVTSRYLHDLLKTIKGTKEEFVIEEVALRSMMKAEYSTNNIGHFGLGFENYTHFTSPIRRYPDLIVHRFLKEYERKDSKEIREEKTKYLNKVCEKSNSMERIALEAERESIKKKQVEYISGKIGEEYQGIISGVMSFGIFVELMDTLVEGLVHIKDLDDDYYIYDEKTYKLVGRDTDRVLRLGDEIRIRVARVNPEEGKVDFSLVP